jgi:hypothetical protein
MPGEPRIDREAAMQQVVNYKGFDIHVMSYQYPAGKCLGTYEITAASKTAKQLFVGRSDGGFSGKRYGTSDDTANNSTVIIRRLIIIAKREIDLAWRGLCFLGVMDHVGLVDLFA